MEQATDNILELWYRYYERSGEFENGVTSYYFAHIDGGVRHITVFEDALAFEMHSNNTVTSPYYN